jgi:hypothetical protein
MALRSIGLVVKQASFIIEVLGSNLQDPYFLIIKTTSAVGQADMWAQPNIWVQADMCAEFKFELELEFGQGLK